MHRAWCINLFEYKHINTYLKSINLKLTFLEEKWNPWVIIPTKKDNIVRNK